MFNIWPANLFQGTCIPSPFCVNNLVVIGHLELTRKRMMGFSLAPSCEDEYVDAVQVPVAFWKKAMPLSLQVRVLQLFFCRCLPCAMVKRSPMFIVGNHFYPSLRAWPTLVFRTSCCTIIARTHTFCLYSTRCSNSAVRKQPRNKEPSSAAHFSPSCSVQGSYGFDTKIYPPKLV